MQSEDDTRSRSAKSKAALDRLEKLWPMLIDDAVEALERADADPTQTQRRAAVRAVFAMVEGITFLLKDLIVTAANPFENFSTGEYALLRDEQYALDQNGNVITTPKYSPTDANFVFALRIIVRHTTPLKLDKGASGWSALQESLKLRNRVTHPKRAQDLIIDDKQYLRLKEAFVWIVSTVTINLGNTVLATRDKVRSILSSVSDLQSSPRAAHLPSDQKDEEIQDIGLQG